MCQGPGGDWAGDLEERKGQEASKAAAPWEMGCSGSQPARSIRLSRGDTAPPTQTPQCSRGGGCSSAPQRSSHTPSRVRAPSSGSGRGKWLVMTHDPLGWEKPSLRGRPLAVVLPLPSTCVPHLNDPYVQVPVAVDGWEALGGIHPRPGGVREQTRARVLRLWPPARAWR